MRLALQHHIGNKLSEGCLSQPNPGIKMIHLNVVLLSVDLSSTVCHVNLKEVLRYSYLLSRKIPTMIDKLKINCEK